MDNKCEIRIILDETGRIGVQSSSQNLCTIFGMLELAKKAYIENSMKPKPIIEEVHGSLLK